MLNARCRVPVNPVVLLLTVICNSGRQVDCFPRLHVLESVSPGRSVRRVGVQSQKGADVSLRILFPIVPHSDVCKIKQPQSNLVSQGEAIQMDQVTASDQCAKILIVCSVELLRPKGTL